MSPRGALILAFGVAVVALSLFAAGCGGSASPRVANVGSSTTTATAPAQGGLVAFAHCMRGHGVPNFPDPRIVGGRRAKAAAYGSVAPTPRAEAANRACRQFLPNGGGEPQVNAQQRRVQPADELSFARCMRGRGLTGFPDPTGQAGLTLEYVQAQGIDVHSTAFLRVAQQCLPAAHHGLTMARLRESIQSAGG